MEAYKPNEKYEELIRSMNGLTLEDHQSHYWQNSKNRPIILPKLRMRNVAKAMKVLFTDIAQSNELEPCQKEAFTKKASVGLGFLSATITRNIDLLPKVADSELIEESIQVLLDLAKSVERTSDRGLSR